MSDWLLVGAGIGGLATAIALQRQGQNCQIWEQALAFGEVGAGIQMGPNVTRILHDWGLKTALQPWAVQPQALIACDALTGHEVGQLDLNDAHLRYGAPYLTIHRADLHELLLSVLNPEQVQIFLGRTLDHIEVHDGGVPLACDTQGASHTARALIGADGVWSRVRQQIWRSPPAQACGHWAYRALLPTRLLSPRWRRPEVRIWMAPGLHAVHYPVRGGQWLNLVLLVESDDIHLTQGWDLPRDPQQIQADVQRALRGLCHDLQDVVRSVEQWRAWVLSDRPPLHSADEMARGPVALLGDAAHPMLPYLAQGAGMAIEDARQLEQCVAERGASDLPSVLAAYAQARWRRNAHVQHQARRNGRIFHAQGPLAWARNAALRMAAPRLMDQPWLYTHGLVE